MERPSGKGTKYALRVRTAPARFNVDEEAAGTSTPSRRRQLEQPSGKGANFANAVLKFPTRPSTVATTYVTIVLRHPYRRLTVDLSFLIPGNVRCPRCGHMYTAPPGRSGIRPEVLLDNPIGLGSLPRCPSCGFYPQS